MLTSPYHTAPPPQIATRSTAPLKGGTSRAAQQVKPTHVPAFHAHPQAYGTPAPARTARDQVHSFLRTVKDGVFAPLKTDPARAHLAPTSFRLSPKPVRLPAGRYSAGVGGARFGGGARRPTVGVPPFPSHPAHVGLGAARNFSAGALPFANVASNVPLALRALGGEGLDERKWRQVRREVRHQLRKDIKGKGRELSTAERQQMRQAEFAAFFGTKAEEAVTAASELAESVVEVEVEAAVASPVVLLLPLEPALALAADDVDSFDGPSSSYRLLPDTVLSSLDAIQQAYATHANRVRALSNRLTRAGVFDDPATAVELVFVSDGRKEVHLTFGPKWTRRDVCQAAGGWRGAEGTFWEVLGGEEAGSSVPSVRSDEMDEHDAVKSTLVLPNNPLSFDATTYSSPAFSPAASTYGSFEDEDHLPDSVAPPLSQEAQVWTDFEYPAAEPFSPALVSYDGEAEVGREDDRWSVMFEEEGSEGTGQEGTEAWSERSYESGVREFLVEVEEGLGGQRMFARM